MTDIDERFTAALHNTARAWRQAMDRRLKSCRVSQAGWMTIAVAAQSNSPLSQSELADRVGVEGATMVAMIDRLVKAKLVVRNTSITDRRVKHVVLTEVGYRVYDTVREKAAAFRRETLSEIEPSRLIAATKLLEDLQRTFDVVS